MKPMRAWWIAVAAIVLPVGLVADEPGLKPFLEKLRAVGPNGAGNREAATAWQSLVKSAQARQLPEILAAFDGAGPLAVNWLRAAVDAVAERELQSKGRLPVAELERFLADTAHSPLARRSAFEWLVEADPAIRGRLIPTLLNDPSLELRRDSVADALAKAEETAKSAGDDKTAAIAAYRGALSAARDEDQIKLAAERLRKLGDKVDLPAHFGFVQKWKLVGPFDNAGTKGFDVAYGPEKAIDLTATYDGKEAGSKIKWIDHTTTDDYGFVDLNKNVAELKGAITYAYAEFVSPEERDIEVRIGCVTANKIWLNGQLIASNNVYHSGTHLDQYTGKGRLKAGTNTILVKVAQNEQTEVWAKDWKFQLRVCDHLGTAVLAQNR